MHSITLLLFGGVSRIEGDATRPRNDIFIALAGPAVSLTIGALLVGWWAAFGPERQFQVTPLHGVLIFTGLMNILVGVFNLLPGYPLDGVISGAAGLEAPLPPAQRGAFFEWRSAPWNVVVF